MIDNGFKYQNDHHFISGLGTPVALHSNVGLPCSGTKTSDNFLRKAGFLAAAKYEEGNFNLFY